MTPIMTGKEAVGEMGRLRFELRTNRLKAECSTAELATLLEPEQAIRYRLCLRAPKKNITLTNHRP